MINRGIWPKGGNDSKRYPHCHRKTDRQNAQHEGCRKEVADDVGDRPRDTLVGWPKIEPRHDADKIIDVLLPDWLIETVLSIEVLDDLARYRTLPIPRPTWGDLEQRERERIDSQKDRYDGQQSACDVLTHWFDTDGCAGEQAESTRSPAIVTSRRPTARPCQHSWAKSVACYTEDGRRKTESRVASVVRRPSDYSLSS